MRSSFHPLHYADFQFLDAVHEDNTAVTFLTTVVIVSILGENQWRMGDYLIGFFWDCT